MMKITEIDIETLSNKSITTSRTTQLVMIITVDISTPEVDGKEIMVSIENVANNQYLNNNTRNNSKQNVKNKNSFKRKLMEQEKHQLDKQDKYQSTDQ